MYDLNNQLLSLSKGDALEELNKYKDIGITDLILTTPVLINGEYEITDALTKFKYLKENVKGINLYLGSELNYHYTLIHRLMSKDVLTINDSDYILLKLPKDKKPEQFKQLVDFLTNKYKIILSCVDHYKYFSYNDLVDLKEYGLLFMICFSCTKNRRSLKLLKKRMVDILCSYDNGHELGKKAKKIIDDEYMNELIFNKYKKFVH